MGARRGGWFLGVASLLVACGSGTPSRYGSVTHNVPSPARRVLVPYGTGLPLLTQEACNRLCPAQQRGEYLPSCQGVGGSDEFLADVAPGAYTLVLCAYQRRP